ncbi:M48 family metallopeptidase [Candidatus Fermentibacterales bacterium]|nr:M48 family metallopeptidase [Candidatus Fermentibacterales bacterium]
MMIPHQASLLLCLAASAMFGLGNLDDIVDIIESDEVESAIEVAEAFREAGRELSDSEEYYLGRAVAANILTLYSPSDCAEFQEYLNLVGAAVALSSPMPATYGGWHFVLLDSDQINAMACPGGLVFICRGLLEQVSSEDELACILAHEVSHVALRHGIRSVENAKWMDAFTTLGTEAAELSGSDLDEITEGFGDIALDITSNLMTTGYSRTSEREADSLAVIIADAAGYDAGGLEIVLDRMCGIEDRSGQGFWQTHPSPESRRSDVEDALEERGITESSDHSGRDARFAGMIAVLDSGAGTATSGRGTGESGSGGSSASTGRDGSSTGTGRGSSDSSTDGRGAESSGR